MWRLTFLLTLPLLVYSFEGEQCGDVKCIVDNNAICDSNVCRCFDGYIGNPRIQCVPDTKRICCMMGDPHVTTFNNESAFIFLPCTQILADLTLPGVTAGDGPRLFFKVTAIPYRVYQARYAAQLMVIGLYIEINSDNNDKLDLRCDTNGCRNILPPYENVAHYKTQSLEVNVTRDIPNGQTVLIVDDIEVRFRAEDGSVSIEIPRVAETNSSNGLCNRNMTSYPNTLGLTYDEYLLLVNAGDIHVDLEKDAECVKTFNSRCSSTLSLEAQTVKFCGRSFVDETIRECYYDYRNKNGSAVLADYNDCHTDACVNTGTISTTYCNHVVAACGAANKPAGCP